MNRSTTSALTTVRKWNGPHGVVLFYIYIFLNHFYYYLNNPVLHLTPFFVSFFLLSLLVHCHTSLTWLFCQRARYKKSKNGGRKESNPGSLTAMNYGTPSPIPYIEEEDLMIYPVSAESIECEVLQDCITSLPGPRHPAVLMCSVLDTCIPWSLQCYIKRLSSGDPRPNHSVVFANRN